MPTPKADPAAHVKVVGYVNPHHKKKAQGDCDLWLSDVAMRGRGTYSQWASAREHGRRLAWLMTQEFEGLLPGEKSWQGDVIGVGGGARVLLRAAQGLQGADITEHEADGWPSPMLSVPNAAVYAPLLEPPTDAKNVALLKARCGGRGTFCDELITPFDGLDGSPFRWFPQPSFLRRTEWTWIGSESDELAASRSSFERFADHAGIYATLSHDGLLRDTANLADPTTKWTSRVRHRHGGAPEEQWEHSPGAAWRLVHAMTHGPVPRPPAPDPVIEAGCVSPDASWGSRLASGAPGAPRADSALLPDVAVYGFPGRDDLEATVVRDYVVPSGGSGGRLGKGRDRAIAPSSMSDGRFRETVPLWDELLGMFAPVPGPPDVALHAVAVPKDPAADVSARATVRIYLVDDVRLGINDAMLKALCPDAFGDRSAKYVILLRRGLAFEIDGGDLSPIHRAASDLTWALARSLTELLLVSAVPQFQHGGLLRESMATFTAWRFADPPLHESETWGTAILNGVGFRDLRDDRGSLRGDDWIIKAHRQATWGFLHALWEFVPHRTAEEREIRDARFAAIVTQTLQLLDPRGDATEVPENTALKLLFDLGVEGDDEGCVAVPKCISTYAVAFHRHWKAVIRAMVDDPVAFDELLRAVERRLVSERSDDKDTDGTVALNVAPGRMAMHIVQPHEEARVRSIAWELDKPNDCIEDCLTVIPTPRGPLFVGSNTGKPPGHGPTVLTGSWRACRTEGSVCLRRLCPNAQARKQQYCGVWDGGRYSTRLIAAMGDSFSSGEGVVPYDLDSNIGVSESDPVYSRCHRSLTAWPMLLPDKLWAAGFKGEKAGVRSVACSGAEIRHIRTERQYPGEDLAQLERVNADDEDIITLTIGGNDVGFANVLRHCARLSTLPISCTGSFFGETRVETEFREALRRASDNLRKLYARVREKAGPDTTVVVVGYPQLFPDLKVADRGQERCLDKQLGHPVLLGRLYSDEDLTWFRKAARKLRDTIKNRAKEAGLWFVDVIDDFVGHEICGSDTDWIDAFTWQDAIVGIDPDDAALRNRPPDHLAPFVKGGVPGEGSFHPNAAGQAGYAEAVAKGLRRIVEDELARGHRLTSAGFPRNPKPTGP